MRFVPQKETFARLGLLTVSAVLMFVGFSGFGVWPLAFVAMVPALFVFDPLQRTNLGSLDLKRPYSEAKGNKRFFWEAWFFGYVTEFGGFYWLVNTLVSFGGFPTALSVLFASIFFVFQGLQFVAILALFRFLRNRAWPVVPAITIPYMASEWLFPMLFEHYYGSTFHSVPMLAQVADLGGPTLCTALAMCSNGLFYELLFRDGKDHLGVSQRARKIAVAIAAAYILFVPAYGFFRLQAEDAIIASAQKIRVGVVQTNMGIFEKWEEPREAQKRHVLASHQLELTEHPDLIVWPESAVTHLIPSTARNLRRALLSYIDEENFTATTLETPILLGALRREMPENSLVHGVPARGALTRDAVRPRDYNTAFLTDQNGAILGHYDKTYLLAFGEYLPFGETFPILYDWSPNSGRWTQGTSIEPMVLPRTALPRVPSLQQDVRITTLICYEDIVAAFTRRAMNFGNPHFMVNVTMDTWFGDTQEPWVHFALAKFRTIEHRRFMVRSTNSGVSAIVDSAGRSIKLSGTFRPETLAGDVALLADRTTLYSLLGAWPSYLSVVAMVIGWLVSRRKQRPTVPMSRD